MRVAVLTDHRFIRAADGSVWTTHSLPYSFWRRYLEVFSAVRVVARVRHVASAERNWSRADGESVSFVDLPDFRGILGAGQSALPVMRGLANAASSTDAVVLRGASLVATLFDTLVRTEGRPFGIEVTGDPDQVFAPGVTPHPFRPIVRSIATRSLRRQCAAASAVAYVTSDTLPDKYPASPGAYVAYYSSVELQAADCSREARSSFLTSGIMKILTIGSMEQPYKGIDILIDAVTRLSSKGISVTLDVIGEGRYRRSLEDLTRQRGVSDRIVFWGAVSDRTRIREALDTSDVFVLASRTEGLPRAMIEAMARGVPCVGSAVGGIRQLLNPQDLFPAEDSGHLAEMLQLLAGRPDLLREMAERNLKVGESFLDSRMALLRHSFYEHVKLATESWARA